MYIYIYISIYTRVKGSSIWGLGCRVLGPRHLGFISQNVFIKSFCKSELPHKSVNLSFIITNTKKVDNFVRKLTF